MLKIKHTITIILIGINMNLFSQTYTMPFEGAQHEGTWLQWPHSFTYGTAYRNSLDLTWIDMTNALVASEKVHIIAYNNTEKTRIINLLNTAAVSLTNVDFFIHQNDDVWVRDNGPIFVYDNSNNLKILDWDFNGWGLDAPFAKDNVIPQNVSTDLGITRIDLSVMVLEGGAIEHDGNGTMIATKSSLTTDRNIGLNFSQIENYLTTNMGFTKFIWLDGKDGGSSEITDQHIDGFMRFANPNTIVTMSNTDLAYWDVSATDITILNNAKDINNTLYNFITVPLTQNDVITTNGTNLGYKGSYINYYEANTVVLVPNYIDPNDALANNIIQGLYPGKTVIGIDCRNLYENGGMVHCVTQQQPVNLSGIDNHVKGKINNLQNFPNPFSKITTINMILEKDADVQIEIYNSLGQMVVKQINSKLSAGNHFFNFSADDLQNGIYNYVVKINKHNIFMGRMIVLK